MEKQFESSTRSRRSLIGAIIIVILAMISVSILFTLRVTTGSINPFFIVASDSMVPTLQVGDVIVINQHQDAASFATVKIDDIIAFKNQFNKDGDGHEITMTHRVVEINKTANGVIVMRTKGDNNPSSIPKIDYQIYKQNYIGKVVYKIPTVGILWWRFIYPPITFGIIAAALIPSIYFFVIRKLIIEH